VISSGLSFKLLFLQFGAEPVEAPADACVESHRACLEDDAADQVGVDAPRRHDLPAGSFFDLRDHVARLVVGELDRRRQLDVEDPLLARREPLELASDLLDLAGAALLGEEHQEVADELVLAAEQLLERRRLDAVLELGVA
jgi:hypothetical protein